MINNGFFDEISSIEKNLKDYFSHQSQTEQEIIFSRLAKMTEEIWELNKEILRKFYKREVKPFSQENLEWEIADVFITLVLLARSLNIDINKVLVNKFKIIKERGWI